MPRRSITQGLAVLLALSPAAIAQSPDTSYARQIRELTSDPKFLAPTVSTLPQHATIPSPRTHFRTIIGAPGVMHRTTDIYAYYRKLAETTPRVRVEKVGTSEEGRELLLVIVADETLLADAGKHREGAARLADPRTTTREQAEILVASIKPSYYLAGGLHSTEMGSPEMLMELVYRLAVSDDPQIRAIRQNVITLVNPVAEPDGRDRQVDWYYRYTRGRKEWDDGFPRSTPYWGKYVFHDNNRDGIQISQALTQAFYKSYFDWHPVIEHDLHESVPLLYISTGTGPYNETIDPITIGEWQLLANHDMTTLTAQGLPGVWTWGFYDGWYPGYALWIANNHNGIGRFYETFGNAGADTYVRDLSTSRFAGELVTTQQWYRPSPPTRKVRWSARDNVNFMQAGVLSSLSYTAANGQTLLRNFYQKGLNAVERGRTQAPYAFFIPERQRDPRRTAYLVNQLRRHGIEVHRRAGADTARGYVVRLDQPYRNLAVTLLTKQNFPSTAPNPPYDDVAWTLGYLYGVEVRAVNDRNVSSWTNVSPLTDTVAFAGAVTGSGSRWLVKYRGQNDLLPALYWLRSRSPGSRAFAIEDRVIAAADTIDIGSVLIENAPADIAGQIAARFGLELRAHDGAVSRRHALDLPRIAVYHFWNSTQDEGWVRYTFDQLGIPYTSIDKTDLRRGGLRARFDAVLVPNGPGSLAGMIHEHDRTLGPMPFTRTDQFPSHGSPMSTPDMTGGMGFEGLGELRRFVDEGGLLLTLREASRLAGESGFVREMSSLTLGQLFHPGSVVRVKTRRSSHPILYGYPETFHIFRGNGSLFSLGRRDRGMMVLQYGTKPAKDEEEPKDTGPMLGIPDLARADSVPPRVVPATPDPYVLSGMVRNDDVIIGQAAIIDAPVGRGHVIAYTFNPLHRYLNQQDFALVWNALLNWNDLPGKPVTP